jgi:aldehyde:ferredoxin oxidoreductase
MAVRDSGVICAFGIDDYISESQIATLLNTDWERLDAMGSRVVELERHFNNERGMDRKDDRLPYELPDFESALDQYYNRRGWNDDGTVPDPSDTSAAAVGDD